MKSDIKNKQSEIEASKLISYAVAQDENRAKLLSTENKIPREKILIIPVSTKNSAPNYKSNVIRNAFQIPEERKIVLHSGSFDDWTYGPELIKAAHRWDDKYILVIHLKHAFNKNHKYYSLFKQIDPNKVILSSTPLTFNKYQEFVSSADFGLVLYRSMGPSKFTQKNIYYIGLSSGKFSMYMKYGLPVITNELPTYIDVFKKYKCGKCVKDITDICETLNQMLPEYEIMQKNAKKLFSDVLDLNNYLDYFEKRLNDLL